MFGVTGRMYARRFPFLFGKSRDLPAGAAVHKSSGGPGVQPSVSVSGSSCSGCTKRWGKAGGPWGRTEGPSLPGQGLVLVTVEPSSLWAERITETLPWSRVVLEGPFRAGMALRLPTVVSVSAPCPPRPLWSPPLSCGELGDGATGEFSDTLSLREGSRVTWLF